VFAIRNASNFLRLGLELGALTLVGNFPSAAACSIKACAISAYHGEII
jgi:hypothetical protein